MKRSGFKWKPRKPLKRTPFHVKQSKPMKRTTLHLVGHSETSEIKVEIQAELRAIAILRDGGCIYRFYPGSGKCGGRSKSGELILQFDHLNSRTHAISFADSRLGVCACQRHHIFWKPQEPDLYMKIARKHIGKERSKLLDRVQADHRAYKMDWKLQLLALKKERQSYEISR